MDTSESSNSSSSSSSSIEEEDLYTTTSTGNDATSHGRTNSRENSHNDSGMDSSSSSSSSSSTSNSSSDGSWIEQMGQELIDMSMVTSANSSASASRTGNLSRSNSLQRRLSMNTTLTPSGSLSKLSLNTKPDTVTTMPLSVDLDNLDLDDYSLESSDESSSSSCDVEDLHDNVEDNDDSDSITSLTNSVSQSLRSFMTRMHSSSKYFQDVDYSDVVISHANNCNKETTTEQFIQNNTAQEPQQASQQNPNALLDEILEGIDCANNNLPTNYWDHYFLPITKDRTNGYTNTLTRVVRSQDLTKLQQLHGESATNIMNACNAHGESLITLACRRQSVPVLQWLITVAKSNLNVRDDWGKTPLHELCWSRRKQPASSSSNDTTSEANVEADSPSSTHPNSPVLQAALLFLQQAPELLLVPDKRGFRPLQFVPKESWAEWCMFLQQHQVFIRAAIQHWKFNAIKDQLQTTVTKLEKLLQ